MFNVSFLVQDKLFGPQTRAMYDISKLLATGESNASDSGQLSLRSSHNDPAPSGTSGPGSSWARKMLFPEKSDGVMQTTLTKGMLSHRWFDTELNFEQQVRFLAFVSFCPSEYYAYVDCIESRERHNRTKLWYRSLSNFWASWNGENKDHRRSQYVSVVPPV